jgi:hypothetical protein
MIQQGDRHNDRFAIPPVTNLVVLVVRESLTYGAMLRYLQSWIDGGQ